MEHPRIPNNDRLKQHHTLYKLKTPPWKETVRERCYQRFKSSRGRLVDKFRGLELCNDETIDVLMKENWKTVSNRNDALESLFPGSTNELDSEDINEFISIMEEIQKELLEEERKFLEEYAATEASSIDSTVVWFEREEVICPICKKYPLNQIHTVIFCCCGVQIDVQQDGLTLKHLKIELQKGLDTHEESCKVTPSFSILHLSDITNLAITCGVCHFMYIVI